MIAPFTVILLQINWLIGGVVVTELVFAYPGFGRMLLDASLFGDISLIEAATLVALLVATATQLLSDVGYRVLDPQAGVIVTASWSAPRSLAEPAAGRGCCADCRAPAWRWWGWRWSLFWVVLALLAPVLPLADRQRAGLPAMAHPGPSAQHLARRRSARARHAVAPDLGRAHGAGGGAGRGAHRLCGRHARWACSPATIAAGSMWSISRVSDVILSLSRRRALRDPDRQYRPSALNIVVAVVLASAPGIARIVRGLVLSLMHQEFVAAAYLRRETRPVHHAGRSCCRTAAAPLITDFCLRLGYTTITIGTLGFLGLGLPPPDPGLGRHGEAGDVDAHRVPAHGAAIRRFAIVR